MTEQQPPAEARAGAEYAGDPDPYRTAEDPDDDVADSGAPEAGAPGEGPIGVTDTRPPAGPVSAP